MLQHRAPAAGETAVERRFGEFVERQLLELVLRAVPRRAGEGDAFRVVERETAGRHDRRHALQLAVFVAGPRRLRAVADFDARFDQILPARENVYFAHFEAGSVLPFERHFEFVGAVGERVVVLFRRELRLVIRRDGRADQPILRDEECRRRRVEQTNRMSPCLSDRPDIAADRPAPAIRRACRWPDRADRCARARARKAAALVVCGRCRRVVAAAGCGGAGRLRNFGARCRVPVAARRRARRSGRGLRRIVFLPRLPVQERDECQGDEQEGTGRGHGSS